MEVQTNVPLKNYTTMQVGGPARFVAEVATVNELMHVLRVASEKALPVLVLGGGSNVIVSDEGYKGIVIIMKIKGFEVIAQDGGRATIKVGAGENWDEVVKRSVELSLSGIESLSAIPGTAGGTPVQNVGAYGQEIADVFVELEAFDTGTKKMVRLSSEDCGFSYRSSIFKTTAKGKYIITSISLQLSKNTMQPPFYDSLQAYLDEHNVTYYTPQIIRDAVIAIRADKLPNPTLYPNTGSFFKNPIVERWLVDDIKKNHEDVPAREMPDGTYKIPAAWLIETAGKKGYASRNMKVDDKHALVLINTGGASYADLRAIKLEIVNAVRDMFRIELQQEPEDI